MPAAGELACLAAALLWAVAVVMFRSSISLHGAATVNTLKGVFATVLLVLTVVVVGGWREIALAAPPELLLLAASGVVGITIGDTALFAAVARIGVHRSLLLQTTAPLFTAAIAATLGERLAPLQTVGGLVVLVGVALVIGGPRSAAAGAAAAGIGGVLFGALAAFGQGTGVVLAKQGLAALAVLPATTVRLAAASAGLLLVAWARGRLRSLATAVGERATLRRVVPATILGTYVAMLLLMLGVSLAPAAVAAVLLATTPVFSLALEALIERRPPTKAAVLGTLLTVAGVALLTAAG